MDRKEVDLDLEISGTEGCHLKSAIGKTSLTEARGHSLGVDHKGDGGNETESPEASDMGDFSKGTHTLNGSIKFSEKIAEKGGETEDESGGEKDKENQNNNNRRQDPCFKSSNLDLLDNQRDDKKQTAGTKLDELRTRAPSEPSVSKTQQKPIKSHQIAPSSSSLSSCESKPLAFTDPRQRHVFAILTSIQKLRETRQYSDVTVKVDGQEFPCHRLVLSSTSSIFSSLLEKCRSETGSQTSETGNGQVEAKSPDEICLTGSSSKGRTITITAAKEQTESGANRDVIHIKGMSRAIFEKVMDYMYCVFDGIFSDCDCLELLLAAESLKLSDLCQICTDHIVEGLTVENVFDVIKMCDAGSTSLHTANAFRSCLMVIRQNFSTLLSQDEFLTLSRHHMISLVADCMVNVPNEMDTIQTVLRWVKHKPSERSADLTLMLQHIRFPLMTSKELDLLKDTSMLADNSLAMALVEESRAYSLLDFPERMAWPRQNCVSRSGFPTRDFLLWTAYRDKGLHLLSLVDSVHYQVATFSDDTVSSIGFTFDSTATVCCYDNKLIFTGGEFNTDLAWSLDSSTGEIAVLSKMPRSRKFHSAVAMRGWVYCLGGQDKRGYSVFDSVDAYLVSKGVWVKVGHLAVAAYNMAAVCSKGAIYMVGGVDHSGQQLRIVQCFVALRSGLYSAFKLDITNMPPSLLSARVVVSGFQANVYVVCGHGEIYRLDAEENLVHHVATLKSLSQNPRVRFGAAHVGGFVVVTGGHPLSQTNARAIPSITWDLNTKREVRDFVPLLPADIVNSCLAVKLNANVLSLFQT